MRMDILFRTRGVTGLAALCLMVAMPLPSSADEAVSEIIVTARKREERLQEVPLSITAFDADALKDRNIQSVYDVATFTPNFSFSRNVVGRRLDAPSIRGQFSPLNNFGSEGNVAFFVDGVYISGTSSSLTADNVERIEVLRGPQAAQFGRAAFSGAVNYVTRAPTNEVEGQVYLKGGEDSDYKTSAWLSGPLIEDKLLFFISASWESVDGQWQNSMNPSNICGPGETFSDGCLVMSRFPDGSPRYTFAWPEGQPPSMQTDDYTPLGGESTWNVTGKLTWNVSDALQVNVKAEYTETDDEHFASLFQPDLACYTPGGPACEITADGLRAVMNIADLREGATSSLFGITAGDEFMPSTARPAPFIGTRSETRRYLAEGIYTLNDWELSARATLNHQSLESYKDLDRSPYWGPLYGGVFETGELQRWSDHSYEARATSPQDQPLRATVGVYYFRADNTSYQREYTGFCNRLEYGMPEINGQRSWTLNADKENKAVFGGVAYDIRDDVTLEVEGRYAKDSPVQYAANGVSASTNYYSFTPRATLTWRPADDLNIYGLVAKGNKPGGYFYGYFDAAVTPTGPGSTTQAIDNGDAIVKEENSWTYEIGAKTQWLDRRLTANISVFYIDWTNQAINEVRNIQWACADTGNTTQVPNNVIRNVGQSEVIGSEVELALAATDNLRLAVNYGLASTELKDYKSVIDQVSEIVVDAEGKEAPRVPKHTVTTSATWTRPFGDRGASWFLRGDYVYNSKTWLEADNVVYVGALNLVNTRFGIESDQWTATFYIDNLTDDDTPTLGTQFPNFGEFPRVRPAYHVVPRRGRNAGLTLLHRF
jgi:outer membrane receptor protein involved in Fe transport